MPAARRAFGTSTARVVACIAHPYRIHGAGSSPCVSVRELTSLQFSMLACGLRARSSAAELSSTMAAETQRYRSKCAESMCLLPHLCPCSSVLWCLRPSTLPQRFHDAGPVSLSPRASSCMHARPNACGDEPFASARRAVRVIASATFGGHRRATIDAPTLSLSPAPCKHI